MTTPIKALVAALAVFGVAVDAGFPGKAQAEIMSVQQVRDLLNNGKTGELAATAYAQGVFDGLIAMEYLRRTETGEAKEFCKLIDAYKLGTPIQHPAFMTKALVAAWEKQGRSMSTGFPDLAINYLSGTYGCPKKAK